MLGCADALGRLVTLGLDEAAARGAPFERGEAGGLPEKLGLGEAAGRAMLRGRGEALGRTPVIIGLGEALGRPATCGRGETAPLAFGSGFSAEGGVAVRSLFTGVVDLPRACGTCSLPSLGGLQSLSP